MILRARDFVGRLRQRRSDQIALRRIQAMSGGLAQPGDRSSPSKGSGVILFTTHKSASTLMMQLLRKIAVLNWSTYLDYERCLWRNGDQLRIADHELFLRDNAGSLFQGGGEIYGPIRYPVPINLDANNQLKTLFFLRDPRDVLISAFHSFGYLHPIPKDPIHAAAFLQERSRIQAEGLDAFAIRKAKSWMAPTLNGFRSIRDRSVETETIHYEMFSRDPVKAASIVLDALGEARQPIRKGIIEFMKNQVPSSGISVTHLSNPTHIRSGATRQFEEVLTPQTLCAVTDTLAEELTGWGFTL